jgi:hypothetical protein
VKLNNFIINSIRRSIDITDSLFSVNNDALCTSYIQLSVVSLLTENRVTIVFAEEIGLYNTAILLYKTNMHKKIY